MSLFELKGRFKVGGGQESAEEAPKTWDQDGPGGAVLPGEPPLRERLPCTGDRMSNKTLPSLPKLVLENRPVSACGENTQSTLSSDTNLNAMEDSQKSSIFSATDNR